MRATDAKPLIGLEGVWWTETEMFERGDSAFDSRPPKYVPGLKTIKGWVRAQINWCVGYHVHVQLVADPATWVCVALTAYDATARLFQFESVQAPYMVAKEF